jgi:hypothetical protein
MDSYPIAVQHEMIFILNYYRRILRFLMNSIHFIFVLDTGCGSIVFYSMGYTFRMLLNTAVFIMLLTVCTPKFKQKLNLYREVKTIKIH